MVIIINFTIVNLRQNKIKRDFMMNKCFDRKKEITLNIFNVINEEDILSIIIKNKVRANFVFVFYK